LQIGGQGNIDWAPVSFYVITHPKGNIIFDTGNNDKTITIPKVGGVRLLRVSG
jgi:N-acyl homoserine lactone hydrolase